MSLAPHFFRARKPARWRLTLAWRFLTPLNRNGLRAARTASRPVPVPAPNRRGAASARGCSLETSMRLPAPPTERGRGGTAARLKLRCALWGLALLVPSGFVAWPEEKVAQSKCDHWAFKPVVRPTIPAVKNRDWPRSPIDNFVLARLEAKKLAASHPAHPLTPIRRLSFVLLGLPPPPTGVRKFVSDP